MMKNLDLLEVSPSQAFERIQNIREKVHLDFATHEDIEELNELENIFQENMDEFQSEFWL